MVWIEEPFPTLKRILDNLAHQLLLGFDGQCAINDSQAEFVDHLVVFIQDAALEDAKAVDAVFSQVEVHAGFVILDLGTRGGDALDGYVHRDAEQKRNVGLDGEGVHAAHPGRVDAARNITRKGGEGVAVSQHDHAGFEQRVDAVFPAVGEVGALQDAECGGGEGSGFLCRFGGAFDEHRGVPFAEVDRAPLRLKPFIKQIDLGGFTAAIDAFDDDQLSLGVIRF